MDTRLSLFFERGFATARVFDLSDGLNVVGSSESCDVTVPDIYVSRRHIEFNVRSGVVQARDLYSKNGSLVNGEPVGPGWREIGVADCISLAEGRVSLRVVSGHETIQFPDERRDENGASHSIALDIENRVVLLNGQEAPRNLSETQFNIFKRLLESLGVTVRSTQLKGSGWTHEVPGTISDSALRTQISRIRKWMESCRMEGIAITDVRGIGYRLEDRQSPSVQISPPRAHTAAIHRHAEADSAVTV